MMAESSRFKPTPAQADYFAFWNLAFQAVRLGTL